MPKKQGRVTGLLTVLRILFDLAVTLRSGWPDRDVRTRIESDMEHSAKLAILGVFANIILGRKLDDEELFGQASVHDWHEISTTDLNPSQVFLRRGTRRRLREFWSNAKDWIGDWLSSEKLLQDSNRKAMWKLTEHMDSGVRRKVRKWWKNYHGRRNPEAEFLRQLHPILDAATGIAYGADPANKDMASIESFFEEAARIVNDPDLLLLLQELRGLSEAVFGMTQGN